VTVDTSRSALKGSRKIGLVGGTFDPPHVGHLALAACARHQLDLDEVRLIVANDPWQKSSDRKVTGAADRLAMVELAVAADDDLVVSDIEIDRGGPSYTVDTITDLVALDPKAEFSLVLGTDVAAQLDTWHRHDELRQMVTVALAERPGALRSRPLVVWIWSMIDMPRVRLSSSELRDRLRRGANVDFLVPASVIEYATEHGLYS